VRRLRRLCDATRAISPLADIRFIGIPDRDDMWVVRVAVRDAILVETAAGALEKVVEEATKKLKTMSRKIIAAADRNGNDETPSSRESTIPCMPPPPSERK